jgi:hypothetical protein
VYSLGVILYELLIGTVSYESAGMRRAGLPEMLRIIREEEAPALPRKRYRELFREEIADTVGDPVEVESELRYLAAVLSKR